jgi:hypothetical protein
MQKVEGSNPFIRFSKGLNLQAFLVGAVGWCVCMTGHPMHLGDNTPRGRFRNILVQACPDDSKD